MCTEVNLCNWILKYHGMMFDSTLRMVISIWVSSRSRANQIWCMATNMCPTMCRSKVQVTLFVMKSVCKWGRYLISSKHNLSETLCLTWSPFLIEHLYLWVVYDKPCSLEQKYYGHCVFWPPVLPLDGFMIHYNSRYSWIHIHKFLTRPVEENEW